MRGGWRSLAQVSGLAGLVVAGVLVGSPLVAVTAPLAVGVVLCEWDRRRRWRVQAARAEALPGAVDHLIQQLTSGASLGQACRSLGREPLRALGDASERRATLAEAVASLADDADPSVRLVATTLGMLDANGGPAVPALRRLRHTLVGRAHRRERAAAQAASALASARMLVLAPALFAALLAWAEPALASLYLREPIGAVCATASVMLSSFGWWWMQATVTRAVGTGS